MVDSLAKLDPSALEERTRGTHGELTLADVYRILRARWENGDRDRELLLHLYFLSWYGMIEPPFVFGPYDEAKDRLLETFLTIFNYIEPKMWDDPELLYVIGLPIRMWPWMFGEDSVWAARAEEYRARYRELLPNGLASKVFANRGEFGDYHRHQVGVAGGF